MREFLAPDDGSEGSGSSSPTATMFAPVGAEPAPAPSESRVEPVVDPTVPVAVAPAIDYEKLAATFGGELRKSMPPPAVPAQKELSQEEMETALNKFKVTPEWIARYDNLETRSAAMQEMVDGTARHADTIAQARLMQQNKQWEERFTPLIEQQRQQAAVETEKAFHAAYPDLAKPELAPVVGAIVQSLSASGQKFSKRSEFFDAVANGVDGVFKAHNPEYKPTRTKVPVANNSLPLTTPGAGGGGGGGQPATTTGLPRAAAFFPKIRV